VRPVNESKAADYAGRSDLGGTLAACCSKGAGKGKVQERESSAVAEPLVLRLAEITGENHSTLNRGFNPVNCAHFCAHTTSK
jgi:hypothetical protein